MLTHIVHTNNSHWSMDQAKADLEEGVANLLMALTVGTTAPCPGTPIGGSRPGS